MRDMVQKFMHSLKDEHSEQKISLLLRSNRALSLYSFTCDLKSCSAMKDTYAWTMSKESKSHPKLRFRCVLQGPAVQWPNEQLTLAESGVHIFSSPLRS